MNLKEYYESHENTGTNPITLVYLHAQWESLDDTKSGVINITDFKNMVGRQGLTEDQVQIAMYNLLCLGIIEEISEHNYKFNPVNYGEL